MAPTAQYLVKYNGYTLPGYAQSEAFDSQLSTSNHVAPYADGAFLESTGLQNKQITVAMKIWGQDYADCKKQVEQAATMLRSLRQGTGILYVMYSDRYYDAIPKTVKYDKAVPTSVRTLDYTVEFDAKPWLKDTNAVTVSGTAMNGTLRTISTPARSIDDGGWTPTVIKVSGKDITISGYTADGINTGFISISGSVKDMYVDTEVFVATQFNYYRTGWNYVPPPRIKSGPGGLAQPPSGGYTQPVPGNVVTYSGWVNMNDRMLNADYTTYVGVGTTYFAVSGAQMCEISYENRWYL